MAIRFDFGYYYKREFLTDWNKQTIENSDYIGKQNDLSTIFESITS